MTSQTLTTHGRTRQEASEDFHSSLRDVMRNVASSVIVVTAPTKGEETVGMTANSFVSLSFVPNLVAVSLNQSCRTLEAIHKTGFFVVNLLGRGQADIAAAFSRNGEHRPRLDSCKRLNGAAAGFGKLGFLSCRLVNQIEVGDHELIIGEVETTCIGSGEPLIYHNGRYREIQ